jgi:hypothetical protein
MTDKPEFEILINRFGYVGVYRRHTDGHLSFWTYARTIPQAIEDFKNWPVRIVAQGTVLDPPTL